MFRHFLLIAALPLAAETALQGPVSGYIFDSASLRPIVGVPGAAYLGDALLSNARSASVSPDGRNVIANVDGQLVWVRGLGTGEASSSTVEADMPEASIFAWNESSSAVAVYGGSGGIAVIGPDGVRRLPAPDAPVTSMILASNGTVAVAAEGQGVVLIEPEATPRLVSRHGRPSSLLAAGADLYFASADSGEILRIANYLDGGDATVFASGVADVSGLAFVNGTLIAASRSARSVTAFRSSGEPAGTVQLDFEPSSLIRAGEGLWLLNSGRSPAQVLDQNLQAWFVPAPTTDR